MAQIPAVMLVYDQDGDKKRKWVRVGIVEASDFVKHEALRSSSLASCSLLYLISVPLRASVCVDSKGLVSD